MTIMNFVSAKYTTLSASMSPSNFSQYVMNSMPPGFFEHDNNDGKTPESIFTNEEHKKLVEDGNKWLTRTSKSCSVVAALIATVAFTTATALPGAIDQSSGFPLLDGQPGFKVFAISALVALCFSVTSLVMFLSFVTSSCRQEDFESSLPAKLMLNLTSLFLSIAAMLVAFCADQFFLIDKQIKRIAHVYLIYAVVCLPVTLFALLQFPLYLRLFKATFARVPERGE